MAQYRRPLSAAFIAALYLCVMPPSRRADACQTIAGATNKIWSIPVHICSTTTGARATASEAIHVWSVVAQRFHRVNRRCTARLACLVGACFLALAAFNEPSVGLPTASSISRVKSKDGVFIAIECAGAGPTFLIVHGGTGDRSRWTPLFPLLVSNFRVCAMDRRGHGASGDSSDYSLHKEAEDVAAVVNSRRSPVFVLGHSYGGVAALEATFLTDKISKLALYEPPLQDRDHTAVADKLEKMIGRGEREQALVTFLQEIVFISPGEVAAMRSRPSWPGLVASIESQVRQIRALNQYHFDPQRMSSLKVPILLLRGGDTASPELKRAISGLLDSLPNRKLIVFEGQQHNAMDTIPQQFAEAVTNFFLSTR